MAETSVSSYVGIADNRSTDSVFVWERSQIGGPRTTKSFPAPYYFFVEAEPGEKGEYTGISKESLKKLEFSNYQEFTAARNSIRSKKFESDITPLQRVLMDNYYGNPIPKLHYAFFDIESEIIKGREFSKPANPFAPINAITIYKQWLNKFVTIAVPPPKWEHGLGSFPINVEQYGFAKIECELILVSSEAELLSLLLEHIEDIDFISGWNSEFYDLPYIYKRLEIVLGKKAANQLSFAGARAPNERMVERFGKEELTIQLSGRAHLDYMDMFKKFTFEGRESFRLEAIAHEELGFNKLEHDGLAKLYYEDFEKFVHYNIVDVILIMLLDEKFNFVQLVNQMAHENTVPFEAILGTTKYVDSGIMNYAINVEKVRVHDKEITEHGKVEGAIVLTPNIGLHEWLGSIDITSLYPSVIRSLNLSPEKVIGQFDTEATKERLYNYFPKIREAIDKAEAKGNEHILDFLNAASKEEDWRGIMNKDNHPHTLILCDGTKVTATGAEWNEKLKESRMAISAYGTVLDQSSGPGILPKTLSFWFGERKKLQKQKKEWSKKLQELKSSNASNEEIQYAKDQEAHYDLLQLTKKIQLNSAYGALLAKGFRWAFHEQIGASVTYSGRAITSHMAGKTGELLTGTFTVLNKNYEIDPKGKIQNIYTSPLPDILAMDTDSVYFKTSCTNKEEAIEVADAVAEEVNKSFPEFMQRAFNCQPTFDTLIAAGREVVAERGLFQARKKYMLKVVDLEGFSVNKLKAMGSEIKKSDTPKVIQSLLKDVVNKILDGESYDSISAFVIKERKRLFAITDIDEEDKLLFGIAKAANNLDLFDRAYEAELNNNPMLNSTGSGKLTIPGHVRAAINFNRISKMFDGNDGLQISSGDKVKVFNLKQNDFDYGSVALPAEIDYFPYWFEETFQVDLKATEEKLVTAKLDGIFSAWGYAVPTAFEQRVNKLLVF